MRKLKPALLLIFKCLLFLLALPLTLPVVLIIRLMRPFYRVRFQMLNSSRIGHFAINTELYLCERDAGLNTLTTPYVDLWFHARPVCNKQLAQMWERVLRVWPGWLLSPVSRINAIIPGGDAHIIGNNTQGARDVHNLMEDSPPHLRFLPEEEDQGEAGLRNMGIPSGAPFVCLIVRDAAYLNALGDYSYHNYRDCDIQNYVLAAEELAKRGYYVVRMGAIVKEAMKVTHPMIIDYAANSMRNDFMDIYLGAKCEFCISNGTGFDAVPAIFRKPIVYVDNVPLGIIPTYRSNVLATTKGYWLRNEGRFMTFREIVNFGASQFLHSSQYKDMGIDLIESTPEEIAAVVLEMEMKLKGTWQITKEDEELQRRFWEIFPRNNGLHGKILARIGTQFLRNNKEWLE